MKLLQRFRLNTNDGNNDFLGIEQPIGSNIPKIVSLTTPTKNLTKEVTENLEVLKKNNPDWQFKLYTNADQQRFVSEHFPQILKYFDAIDISYGAAKADLFRYLLIYKYGGVYIDIKSSFSKPLNQIISNDTKYILTHWENASDGRHPELTNEKGEYQQWHIISVSGHPFLRAVINNVCQNIIRYNPFIHGKAAYSTLRVTGPIAYTLAIDSKIDSHPHEKGYSSEFGLIYSIYSDNMKNKPVHREASKYHYAAAVKPMIKQPLIMELIYTQSWRCIWKLQGILNKIIK